jgi:hypothetical protein
MTYLWSDVTGCYDAILDEVCRTTAVSLVGAHHGPGGALGAQLWDTFSWSHWATSVSGSGLV